MRTPRFPVTTMKATTTAPTTAPIRRVSTRKTRSSCWRSRPVKVSNENLTVRRPPDSILRGVGRAAPAGALVESKLMRKIALLVALVAAAGAGLGARQPVRARHGMVAAREAHATDIGVAVLEAGGNAIDAAVAVGFALAVTHPSAGNLGGGGFLLARFADGRTTFLDFRERAPASASRNMYLDAAGKATQDSLVGYRASGVPGMVKGLEFAHRKYGRKAWAELVARAVALAAKGFPVSFRLANSLEANERLPQFEESKRIFLKGG